MRREGYGDDKEAAPPGRHHARAAPPLVAACDTDQAFNRGKPAITLTSDVQDLGDAATSIGQLVDEGHRQQTLDALKKVADDTEKIHQNGGDKLGAATDRLSKAIDAIDRASDGRQPDFEPITDAAGDIGKTCAGD
ncbi:hypothetical protein [Kitasatospora brasiliensis]|uniref:hypothetical protein n=1 Tax=Kitasatospora brasiliensis TaxID=3058040 RepID=UPI0029317832|nr:hypothetical protein [Kitasatospora sp. K002]